MALEGTLNYLDIAHLLQVVGNSKKTGVLEIRWQEREARLFFENGELIRAESNRGYQGIGSLLVDAGVINSEMLEAALATQRSDRQRRRLGAILCDELDLRPAVLQQALRKQFESIVFDVFSWPSGTFVFQFTAPGELDERFTINPAEFILEVGMQAGLLAEEARGREAADPARLPVALLVGDAALEAVCFETWRRKGHQVVACGRVEELLGFLGQEDVLERQPVVLVDLGVLPAVGSDGANGFKVLDRLHEECPDVPVVGLGADSGLAVEARRRGAREFVRAPFAAEQGSAYHDTRLEVFALRLEKAVRKAVAGVPTREPPTGR